MKPQAYARPLSAWLVLALAAALLTVGLGEWAWLRPGHDRAAWGGAAMATGLVGLLALGMALRRALDLQHLRQRRQLHRPDHGGRRTRDEAAPGRSRWP